MFFYKFNNMEVNVIIRMDVYRTIYFPDTFCNQIRWRRIRAVNPFIK